MIQDSKSRVVIYNELRQSSLPWKWGVVSETAWKVKGGRRGSRSVYNRPAFTELNLGVREFALTVHANCTGDIYQMMHYESLHHFLTLSTHRVSSEITSRITSLIIGHRTYTNYWNSSRLVRNHFTMYELCL